MDGHEIYRLDAVPGLERLPYSLKVLAENLLRTEDGANITADHVRALAAWNPAAEPDTEISSPRPASSCRTSRACRASWTSPPCARRWSPTSVVTRDVNPSTRRRWSSTTLSRSTLRPTRLPGAQQERSTSATPSATSSALGPGALSNLPRRPPGTGIVHQVNIEVPGPYRLHPRGRRRHQAYPDTCVGTDSHTTMVNGLGVWAGAWAASDRPRPPCWASPSPCSSPRSWASSSRAIPGATATDVVLTITEMLRTHGVVGKFVSSRRGVAEVPLANRATIGEYEPRFGSTAAIFPIDDVTLDYLRLTGRSEDRVRLVSLHQKRPGHVARPCPRARLLRVPRAGPVHGGALDRRAPSAPGPHLVLSGPRSPSRRSCPPTPPSLQADAGDLADGTATELDHGHVAIASITSCTNTCNPR